MHLDRGDKIKVEVLKGAQHSDVRLLVGRIVTGIVQKEWNGTNMIAFKVEGEGMVYYVDDEWFSLIREEKEPSCI
jgi:hypothetical protein